MKHVDVVIISWAKDYELLSTTVKGLNSLFKSESSDIAFHAYVVESNMNVEYDEYNRSDWNHTCTTVRPGGEFGYHKYLNIGRRLGNSKYVVLCNSDLVYEPGWASSLIKVMEENPKILSASPWCSRTLGSNVNHIGNVYTGYKVRDEIAGWCIFQKREIYEIIGDLDEKFTHWYCDNDYAMTIKEKDIIHCLVPDALVNHHCELLGATHKTFDLDYQKKTTGDQQIIFQKKWGLPYGPN